MSRNVNRHLLRALISAAVLAALVLAVRAEADTAIFEEPSATRTSSDQLTFTEPTGYDGETCAVEVAETNEAQPSAHPGNRLVVSTAGAVIAILDIETGRGGTSSLTVEATLGPFLTVDIDLGPDGVSSAGFAVAVTCEEAPPSTTTTTLPASTTTTTSTSTSTLPPDTATTTTTTTTAPNGPTTTQPARPTPPPESPTPTAPPSNSQPPPIPTGIPTGTPLGSSHVTGWMLIPGLSIVAALSVLAYVAWDRRR